SSCRNSGVRWNRTGLANSRRVSSGTGVGPGVRSRCFMRQCPRCEREQSCDRVDPLIYRFRQLGEGCLELRRGLKAPAGIALDGLDQELDDGRMEVGFELQRIAPRQVDVILNGLKRLPFFPGQPAGEYLVSRHPQGEEIDALVGGDALDDLRCQV